MIIKISGYDVIIDESDYEFVMKRKWTVGKSGVARGGFYFYSSDKDPITKRYIVISLHRYIMGCSYGDGNTVDHIDRNTLNNSRSNLRITDAAGNSRNKGTLKNNTTGYKGVHISYYGKYYAAICFNGECIHLGMGSSKEECARMYDIAAIKLFKEFACTNFPLDSYTESEIESVYKKTVLDLHIRTTSGYMGVYLDTRRKTWRASLRIKGKVETLGSYRSPEMAARVYDNKAREVYGDDAVLNFPEENDLEAYIKNVYSKQFSNRNAKNTSGYIGVTYIPHLKIKKWHAQIRHKGHIKSCGFYLTPEEAARAYDKKALELGRDISKLNFPEEVNGQSRVF